MPVDHEPMCVCVRAHAHACWHGLLCEGEATPPDAGVVCKRTLPGVRKFAHLSLGAALFVLIFCCETAVT